MITDTMTMTNYLTMTHEVSVTLLWPTPIVPTPSEIVTVALEYDFLALLDTAMRRTMDFGNGPLFMGLIGFILVLVLGSWGLSWWYGSRSLD